MKALFNKVKPAFKRIEVYLLYGTLTVLICSALISGIWSFSNLSPDERNIFHAIIIMTVAADISVRRTNRKTMNEYQKFHREQMQEYQEFCENLIRASIKCNEESYNE